MLKITATDIYDNEFTLPSPKSLSVNQEINVPADDFSAIFLHIKNLPLLKYISVKENNHIVFKGIVDEQQVLADEGSAYTKIVARSMAALLLDNESKPINYTNPATSVIFEKHFKPLGFVSYKGEDVVFNGSLNIVKGTTNWQAFYSFCINAYGKIPRIEADGTVNFGGVDNKEIIYFSNNDGIAYNFIKENTKLCSLISRVMVKTLENQGYDVEFINPDATAKGVNRVRFIDVTNGVTKIETAEKIINNSIKNSYEITLICPGRLLDILGAKACVNDENIGERDKLLVSSAHYTLSTNGEYTTVKLKKES